VNPEGKPWAPAIFLVSLFLVRSLGTAGVGAPWLSIDDMVGEAGRTPRVP
jgi:hypothetical protein